MAIMERLLRLGVDALQSNANGRTPLAFAAAGGHAAMIQRLLAEHVQVLLKVIEQTAVSCFTSTCMDVEPFRRM